MAYDLFNQPVGPDIKVSLFSDAAQAGAVVGKATPTTTASVISGIREGFKEGLGNLQAIENIQATRIQNQQAPLIEEARRQQIELNKQKLELQQMELEAAQANEQLAIDAKRAQLTNQRDTAVAQIQQRRAQEDYLRQYSQTPAEQRADLIFSGAGDALYATNKELYKQHLQAAASATSDPEKLRAIRFGLGKVNAIDTNEKLIAAAEKERPEAIQKVLTSDLTKALQSSLQGDPTQYPSQVEFVPAGKFKLDPSGSRLERSETGAYVVDPAFTSMTAPNAPTWYYAVSKKDGTILSSSVSKDDKNAYEGLLLNDKIISGQALREDIDALRTEYSPRQGTTTARRTTVPKFNQAEATATQQQEYINPIAQKISEATLLPPSVTKKVSPQFEQLTDIIRLQIQGPTKRVDPTVNRNKDRLVTTLSRTLSDEEFDTSPVLQQRYTEDAVKKYNESVDANLRSAFMATARNPVVTALMGQEQPNVLGALAEIGRVETPKDLYYQTQGRQLYASAINRVINQQQVVELVKQAQPIRDVQRAQSTTAKLTALNE